MHLQPNRTIYKYKKLADRITEKFGTQAKFAGAMQLSERSISLKLNNKVGWRQDEILRASKLLGICPIEFQDYFFDIDFHGNKLLFLSLYSVGKTV